MSICSKNTIFIVTALVLALPTVFSHSLFAQSASVNPCTQFGIKQPFHLMAATTSATRLAEIVPFSVLTYYQQDRYQLQDSNGDLILYIMARLIPKHSIWMTLKSKKLQQAWAEEKAAAPCAEWFFGTNQFNSTRGVAVRSEFTPDAADIEFIEKFDASDAQKQELKSQLEDGKLGAEDHKAPLRIRGMRKMFARVMQQEYAATGMVPVIGETHRWSSEFLNNDLEEMGGIKWVNRFSKLVIALSKGVTGRFMVTGTELELQNWILAQPLNSITLPELFRKSYRLANGNVYLSLLTIENILARDWTTEHRENLPITLRLTRITHEFGSRESRFGDWYHFFGVALFGYVQGAVVGVPVGEVEALGSIIMNHFAPQHQKHSINRNGAIIGHQLKRLVKSQKWKSLNVGDSALESSSYLRASSDLEKVILKKSKKLSAKKKKQEEMDEDSDEQDDE